MDTWLDCEKSLFFYRFSKGNACECEHRETRQRRAAASPIPRLQS